ncbi:MAG: aldehyde dehydrogenase family protein [Gammaproteobacteria bacterium]|nr:aldehyde dehydrogenase family protein [Gammaproteobacteria bacterium]NKB64987.1 aldehyde dehydrogenase family protein [Gammaproteobacteria bacterium]
MIQTNNYIDGHWVGGDSTIANINPSDTRDTIGEYAQASVVQVEEAIAGAKRAQKEWATTGLEQRYNVLMSIGNALMSRSAELGELLCREEGKTRPEGKGEVYRAGQFFTYYAAEVLRQMGEICDSVRPGVEVQVTREPVGVVGMVTPWNFPTALPSWKIAPALAYGNGIVWKPASLTPASAVALMEIIAEQDLPPGLVNMVLGAGSKVGEAIIGSADVDAITFTGSVATGKRIASAAAANLTKVQMEMGSKNPLVILEDGDMETAVACAINGAFGSTGQKCTASSRIIVAEKIHDQFVDAMQAAMHNLVVGHALDEKTNIGPAVDGGQLEQNQRYMKIAAEEGAERVCGGELLELETPGHYMQPALFINTSNDMRINKDEVFGPMTCVIKVADYDEALAVANDTQFGLTSSVITESLAKANHFKKHAKTGCVMVNLPTSGTDYHVPFGGRKSSSFGSREQGTYAAEFYTHVKTTYLKSE